MILKLKFQQYSTLHDYDLGVHKHLLRNVTERIKNSNQMLFACENTMPTQISKTNLFYLVLNYFISCVYYRYE